MDDILTWLKKHKVITFIIAFLVFCGPLIIVHALLQISSCQYLLDC